MPEKDEDNSSAKGKRPHYFSRATGLSTSQVLHGLLSTETKALVAKDSNLSLPALVLEAHKDGNGGNSLYTNVPLFSNM